MLRAIFVGLFNDTFTTKLMITLMIIPPDYRSDPIPTIRLQQISSKATKSVDQSEPPIST